MTTDTAIQTDGIHHVTAIASDPPRNVAFYTEVLGLRLVKRTVNFDDTSTYHLYYGDETGSPGTAMSFFPSRGAAPGRPGRGQPTATAFAVPPGSLDYWRERLADRGADVQSPTRRFGEAVLPFTDYDGQPLELVASDSPVEPWTGGPVPPERSIRGFHGVTLHSTDVAATASALQALGLVPDGDDADRRRYRAAGDRATAVDLLDVEGPDGRRGAGTVHHVAFRVPDEATQDAWRERLVDAGYRVTEPKDRRYFRSIYFREPGGILFEIATDGPGFTRDESVESLGSSLQLPPWLVDERASIESRLPSLSTD